MRLEHFDEKKTDAQNRASCPNEVIDTRWANMLIYWRSPNSSENGKASRKRLVVPHHGGTKSFVNHAIEIEETTQKKASRALCIEKTYRSKEGKTPNPIAEANRVWLFNTLICMLLELAQMEALEREDLEENGSDNDYSKIMGAEKPGRIRGVGSTIKVTKLTGESSSNVVQNNEENVALRDEIKNQGGSGSYANDMEDERLEMKKTVDEMKKANEESRKKVDALLLLFRRDLPHPSHRVMTLLHELR
ncbi:hypothetical protein MKW92_042626 [Papaver armeniacum]|nr:hypothetical protein MKW92_042626 [Papaver armeniacum]